KASPDKNLRPELFMLGSSDGGMSIASQLGIGFAFAGQINPSIAVPMLKTYRENFKPPKYLSEPYSMLSIIVVCAETDEDDADSSHPAELQCVRWMTGQYISAPPTLEEARNHVYTEEEKQAREQNKDKFVIGSPETVKKQLDELAKESGIDEVMIANMITDKEARHKSYELLAKEFNL